MFGLPQAQIEQKLSQVAHIMLVQSFPDMSLGQPPNEGSTRGGSPGKEGSSRASREAVIPWCTCVGRFLVGCPEKSSNQGSVFAHAKSVENMEIY